MTADFNAKAVESLRSDAAKSAAELGLTTEAVLTMWRDDLSARTDDEGTTTFLRWIDSAIEAEQGQGLDL